MSPVHVSDLPRTDAVPRLISNSGGRTSGYMTWLELQRGLGPDDHVVFCNTGKERPETLDFLHEQEKRWGYRLVWLQYDACTKWRQVTYETASRDGRPFEQLILKRQFLPNPVTRFCTQELKIRVIKAYMRSQGYTYWQNLVGIRADEPRRVRNNDGSDNRERWDNMYPLYRAGITKADVHSFWSSQPFDLRLKPHEGNCDLCFLKGQHKLLAILRERPELAAWWDTMERGTGATFRSGVRVLDLLQKASTEHMLFDLDTEPSIACFCGD